jgi:biotin carboxylase
MNGPEQGRESRRGREGGSTPSVLLLMTTRTYRASAFLEAASAAGVRAVAASERPQALAALEPRGHLTLDFADLEAAERAIVAFHATRPLGAVIAADDDGALLAARAARALSLRHHAPEAVAAALDKKKSREIWRRAGLAGPAFLAVSAAADPAALATRVRYPCVVKPLSMSASRGVIRADNPAEFTVAFARSARIAREGAAGIPELLVEDYLPGAEVTLEGLMHEGVLHPLALFDKPDPLEGPFFEETIYVTPSRLPRAAEDEILVVAERAARALGLAHGPVHAELRLGPDGPRPLEIAPRSIGGLCSRALSFAGGWSLERVLLEHALGRTAGGVPRESAASGVMMIPVPGAGRLRGVSGVDAAKAVPDIEDVAITAFPGEVLVPWPEGSRYPGFIFARARAPERVEAALREAHRRLCFDIERTDA